MKSIIVAIVVDAPLERAWECWTSPEHITKWNFASDDWECPWAENDLQVGGHFVSRMSAKDGSEGFDFNGTYTIVEPMRRIAYTIEGGREVTVTFNETDKGVEVSESFELEDINSEELQRAGWQAILNNFKLHTETN